jgi:hypothetical protein
MPVLWWLAIGLAGGFFAGRRSVRWQITGAMRRDASALLDSVGRLGSTGALASVEDLRLRHGSDRDGIKLLIKTRDGAGWGDFDLNDFVD